MRQTTEHFCTTSYWRLKHKQACCSKMGVVVHKNYLNQKLYLLVNYSLDSDSNQRQLNTNYCYCRLADSSLYAFSYGRLIAKPT